MRDMHSTISSVVAIPAATYNADNTPVNVNLDTYDGALILIQVGAGGITFSGTNKIEFVLRHGDSTDPTTHTAVAAADIAGVVWATGGIVRSLVAAHAAATVVEVSYIGVKPNISVLSDFSGTHGVGTPIAVTVLRGFPLTAPVL
jgi:hypothetical protein